MYVVEVGISGYYKTYASCETLKEARGIATQLRIAGYDARVTDTAWRVKGTPQYVK